MKIPYYGSGINGYMRQGMEEMEPVLNSMVQTEGM